MHCNYQNFDNIYSKLTLFEFDPLWALGNGNIFLMFSLLILI